jgi:hypothetical protein
MHVHLMRSSAKEFPPPADPLAVTSVFAWFCKFRSLQALGCLPHLQELKIAGFPDDTLAAIGGLRELRYLSLMHLPAVHDLAPLRGLALLETLSLAVLPAWEGKRRQHVASLEPVAALPALRHLELFGVCPPDLSLAPLEHCPNLVSARFTSYPRREIERFALITQLPDDFAPAPRFEARMVPR